MGKNCYLNVVLNDCQFLTGKKTQKSGFIHPTTSMGFLLNINGSLPKLQL